MAGSKSFKQLVSRFFGENLAGLGGRSPFARLVQRAMKNAEFRERFIADPARELAEAGVDLPEGLEIEIVENTNKVVHLVLPPLLDCGSAEQAEISS